MYDLYLEFCMGKNLKVELIAKKWKYFDVFDTQFKLSFKLPEVDTCNTCDSFQAQFKKPVQARPIETS